MSTTSELAAALAGSASCINLAAGTYNTVAWDGFAVAGRKVALVADPGTATLDAGGVKGNQRLGNGGQPATYNIVLTIGDPSNFGMTSDTDVALYGIVVKGGYGSSHRATGIWVARGDLAMYDCMIRDNVNLDQTYGWVRASGRTSHRLRNPL